MNDVYVPASPMAIEQRLINLSKELDDADKFCAEAEMQFHVGKAEMEVLAARKRMQVATEFADRGIKATVQEKEDAALLEMSDEYVAVARSEATVRAARANVYRVKTQIDITRSVSALQRANMEVLT